MFGPSFSHSTLRILSCVHMTGRYVYTGRFIVKQCWDKLSPLMNWSVKIEEVQTVRHSLHSCAVNKSGMFKHTCIRLKKLQVHSVPCLVLEWGLCASQSPDTSRRSWRVLSLLTHRNICFSELQHQNTMKNPINTYRRIIYLHFKKKVTE